MTNYPEEKLETFEQALNTLREALLTSPTPLERDGAIQRFEYCFDLAWKTAKRYLEKRGLTGIYSPRSVFSAAYAEGMINDEQLWSVIILKRNASVHTYDQNLANTLFSELPGYYKAMFSLAQKLRDFN